MHLFILSITLVYDVFVLFVLGDDFLLQLNDSYYLTTDPPQLVPPAFESSVQHVIDNEVSNPKNSNKVTNLDPKKHS